MTKFSKFLISTAIAAVVLPTAAMAGPVSGSDTGAFANIGSCDSSCIISNTSNGNNSKFQWGADTFSQDPSTLVADKVTVSVPAAGQNGVTIGELTWHNTPIDSDGGRLDSITVDYTLNLGFTTPNATDLFHLTITNTTNVAGDLITTFTAPNLVALMTSINTDLASANAGMTVSNLAYSIDGTTVRIDGQNETATFGGSCGANTWCNPEGATSDLFIKADFTPTVTGVPEPMSLSLFGAGLVGAVGFGLRRRKKA